MAMVVQHNIAAQMALGELNKNNDKLRKSLEKVSNGQKINSAKDDASGYVISEKMREMVRTLEQDNRNVQNGSALLKTAEGGINNIVEELRNLKELAINAATDTNTDWDRAIIQKEFTQKMANINDIASETNYNGKRLLDGSLGNSATAVKGPYNPNRPGGSNGTSLTAGFTPVSGTSFWQPYTNPVNNPVPPHWVSGSLKYPVTESFQGSPTTKVYADFSSYSVSGSVAQALNGKGFSIACGTCSQYLSIKFDGSIGALASTLGSDKKGTPQYTIGIKNVRSMADLAQAIFRGVGTARGESIGPNDTVTIDNGGHNITMYLDSATGKYIIEKNANPLQFYGRGTYDEPEPEPDEVYYGYEAPLRIHHGPKANQSINLYINDMHTKSLGTGKLMAGGMPINDEDIARYDALSYDKNLQTAWLETLSLAQDKSLGDVSVTTQKKANVAIRVIDGAIDYALNESVRMGAYLARLEYTDANVTTMDENVQAAESTIRDADMAKEMTEYTKNNVLLQASQSMLAQANQNSSSVLSLLQ